jgi:hypothetical protein
LSLDAFQENETLVDVAPVAFRFVGVVGAAVSPHAPVAATTDVCAELFPAASYASTENV